MGLTFGAGFFIGSAAGGEIANLAGDLTAYLLAAATCLATFGFIRGDPDRAGHNALYCTD
jgi:predicted MFS family arabinose efflux permease